MTVRTPAVQRCLRGIVVRKVVVRQLDRHIGADVTRILVAERGRVIFQMIEHVESARAAGLGDADSLLSGVREDLEVWAGFDISGADLGPTRDRDRELVGEAAQIGRSGREDLLAIDAEGLLRKLML